jgi:hypothetical protein
MWFMDTPPWDSLPARRRLFEYISRAFLDKRVRAEHRYWQFLREAGVRAEGNEKGGGSGLGRMLTLGMDLAVGVMVLTLGGYWIDQRRGGGQAWTLTGFGLSMVFVGYELWKVLRLINAPPADGDGKPDNKPRADGAVPPEDRPS